MPGTKASYSAFINAPPEKVFEYLCDLSKHGEWAADPIEITPTDDAALGVGKTYTSEAQFRGKVVKGKQTVTAFEPPTKFAFNVKDDTSEHDHTYMFTPQGDGTLVERTALGKWSFGMWLLASTMGGIMTGKPAAKKAFENMKGKLEG